MMDQFSAIVTINATAEKVWEILTTPILMASWMGSEMEITVATSWRVGSPIFIRGIHHGRFENKGWVLQYDEGHRLSYSHLSDISTLPDIPENYCVLDFVLTTIADKIQLTINIRNFPTEVIRKHLEFYWRTTIVKIKQTAESSLLTR